MENTLNMELAPTKAHAWHPQQAREDVSLSAYVTALYSMHVNLSINVNAVSALTLVTKS